MTDMSSVSCAVCGWRWAAAGLRLGVMSSWERKLFMEGAGCPCCEGDEPEGQTEYEEQMDLEQEGEDD